jgi:hypothetical protein
MANATCAADPAHTAASAATVFLIPRVRSKIRFISISCCSFLVRSPATPYGNQGSITPAHASVGAAATWPTTGTIFSPADAIRHGAAANPHPASPARTAHNAANTHNFT